MKGKRFYLFLLQLFRFKPVGLQPAPVKKCVMILAPHTSILDFFLGHWMLEYMHAKGAIVIKKEFFVFPFKRYLNRLGCVPVDRKHSLRFTEFAVNLIHEREEIAFIICPEGTRKRVEKWKRGFYQIAQKAEVPICLSHIDYKSRTLGIGKVFWPTGDYEKDLAEIEQYYFGMKGLHKGHFNLEDCQPLPNDNNEISQSNEQ